MKVISTTDIANDSHVSSIAVVPVDKDGANTVVTTLGTRDCLEYIMTQRAINKGLVDSGVVAPSNRIPGTPVGWPENIPPPDLLRHLAETFFHCLPHGRRLIHRETFLASLAEPPESPRFPALSMYSPLRSIRLCSRLKLAPSIHAVALLHSICAIASFYTTVIEAFPPPPDVSELPSEELFTSTRFELTANPSFGEIHALWATLNGLGAWDHGDRLVEVLQGDSNSPWNSSD